MKYIDAVLKAEIERRIAEYDKWIEEHPIQAGGSPIRERREELASLKENFLDTFSEEPDKSLEEAAYKYSFDSRPSIYGQVDVIDAFIAGAKWQKEQTPLPEDTVIFQKGIAEGKRLMLEDAVEKTVGQLERQCGGNFYFMHGFEVDEMDFPFLNSQECGYGDKVRIIIVKEKKNGQSD